MKPQRVKSQRVPNPASFAAERTARRPSRLPRTLVLVKHDATLQRRYGIVYAYAFVIAFYGVVFHWGGQVVPAWAKVVIVYTDPSVFGFFFLGALMMLEKSENARSALAMSPISAGEYFASKVLTLICVALVAVLALLPFLGAPPTFGHAALLLSSVVLTSVHYLGLGVPAARHFKTVTAYLMGASAWLLPLIGPGALGLLDDVPTWALLVPAVSHVSLLRVALGDMRAGKPEVALMLGVSLVAAWLAVRVALKNLETEFGRK